MRVELTFSYSGEFRGGPLIQWYFNGSPITDGNHSGVVISGTGATTLVIENFSDDWYGTYFARVTDSGDLGCFVDTEEHDLNICDVEITSQPSDDSVQIGDTASLSFAYTSTPTPAIQWYFRRRSGGAAVALTNGSWLGGTVSGATTNNLQIANVQSEHAGWYYATITIDTVVLCVSTTDEVGLCTPQLFYFTMDEYYEDSGGLKYLKNAAADTAIPGLSAADSFVPDLSMIANVADPATIVAGKIGDALWNTTQVGIASTVVTATQSNHAHPEVYACSLNLNQRSFTVRFWIRAQATFLNGLTAILQVDDGSGIHGVVITMGGTNDIGSGGLHKIGVQMFSITGGLAIIGKSSDGIDASAVTDWHRVVIVWDTDSKSLKIQIDNGSLVEALYTVQPPYPEFDLHNTGMACRLFPNTQIEIDEWAVFPDLLWDASDSTTDWNSGNGLTWPDVPH